MAAMVIELVAISGCSGSEQDVTWTTRTLDPTDQICDATDIDNPPHVTWGGTHFLVSTYADDKVYIYSYTPSGTYVGCHVYDLLSVE